MKLRDETLTILVNNLSLRDYAYITKDISNLEIEIERLNKELESKNKIIDAMIDNEEEYCIEINRLNNIINGIEEHLKSEIKIGNKVWSETQNKEERMQTGLIKNTLELTLDKLQELKGSE